MRFLERVTRILSSSQVEKEAEAKGVAMGQALDIAIPPPRPKRKPSNPYPRKTGSGTIPMSKMGVNDGKESLGSEKVSLTEVIIMINDIFVIVCSIAGPHVINTDCVLCF